MSYSSKGKGIFIKNDQSFDDIDSIIFDCDGVLVDVSKSYDLAIKKTTSIVLQKLASIGSIQITPKIISGFKLTGGFNDEVDVTYACILSLISAGKLGSDPKKFISRVIKNSDHTGIGSTEKFLDKLVDLSKIKKELDYPGPHTTNKLYQTFDQIFYGHELYYNIFRQKSQFQKKGLIENDKVILTQKLVDILHKKFQKNLALVTGRGRKSTSYTLDKLLDNFNLNSSLFLEDEPRSMAKPNPKSLLTCIDRLNAKHSLYVGDSMEDLIMAKKANKMGRKTAFCGIYGTSHDKKSKKIFFEKNKADLILESITLLPKALNLAK